MDNLNFNILRFGLRACNPNKYNWLFHGSMNMPLVGRMFDEAAKVMVAIFMADTWSTRLFFNLVCYMLDMVRKCDHHGTNKTM
jgi:hypothetical protein